MFCPQCGTQNSNTAAKCTACGAPLSNPYRPSMTRSGSYDTGIQTYLVPAILTTIFCCMPFGVVAIVYAAITGTKLAEQNYEGAELASATARMWCWISLSCGLVQVLIVLFITVLSGMHRR